MQFFHRTLNFPAHSNGSKSSTANPLFGTWSRVFAKDCENGFYPEFTSFDVIAIDITEAVKLPGQDIPPGTTLEQCIQGLRDLFKEIEVNFRIRPGPSGLDRPFDYEEDFEEDFDYGEYHEDYGLAGGPLGLGEMPTLFDVLGQHVPPDPYYDAAIDDPWETDDEE